MAGNQSTHWLVLWHRFLEAHRRLNEATSVWDEAKFAAEQEYPIQRIRMWDPTIGFPGIKVKETSHFLVRWAPPFFPYRNEFTRNEINEHYDMRVKGEMLNGCPELMSEGQRYRAESLADFDAWLAECAVIDLQHNVPVLSAARNAAMAEFERMQEAILDTPATDVVGIAVKLAVRRFFEGDDNEPEVAAATEDALRLAGLPEDFGIAA